MIVAVEALGLVSIGRVIDGGVKGLQRSKREHNSDRSLDSSFHLHVPEENSWQERETKVCHDLNG